MNNLYKLLAFVCLVFVTSAIKAQTITGTVSPNGLIQVDIAQPWQDEYVINIAQFNFGTFGEATTRFQKYINAFGPYAQITFDIRGQLMYMKIQKTDSVHIGDLTPQSLNDALLLIFNN